MSDGFGGGHDGGSGSDFFYVSGGGSGDAPPAGCIISAIIGVAVVAGFFIYREHQKENAITAMFSKQGYAITEQASSEYNDDTYSLRRNDTAFRAKLDEHDKPVIKPIGKFFRVTTETVTAFPHKGDKAASAEFYKEGYKITEMPSAHNDDIYSLQRNDTAFTAKVEDNRLVLRAIGQRFLNQ